MKGICYIVGAGERTPISFKKTEEDLVVACDGGYLNLEKAGLTPDITIGDFDSLPTLPESGEIIQLNKEKDDTDVGAALNYALEKGYENFRLYCCTGGRLAHTLANIQCLASLARNGKRAFMYGKREIITALADGTLVFEKCKGYISVFSAGNADGVTLKGLKYPLTDYRMTDSYPIGVSNEFISDTATVSVSKGTLIVCFSNINKLPDFQ